MEINLKLTADPELLVLLTRAVKALEKNSQTVEPFGPVVFPSPALVPAQEKTPADPVPMPGFDPIPIPELAQVSVPMKAPDMTSQQLQQKVVELTVKRPGIRAQIRELVNTYAPKLSGVPEGKRAELWAKIEELAKEEN